MRGSQIRTIAVIAACVALYQSAGAASKYLVSDAQLRKTYADSMNLDPDTQEPNENETGVAYFAAGVGNRDFIVTLQPPSKSDCDAALDFLSARQTFLADLDAHGFKNVGCAFYQDGKTTWQTRHIVPKPAPVSPPVSPAPRSAPRRHDPRVVEASA
jgi:hypothetical protein